MLSWQWPDLGVFPILVIVIPLVALIVLRRLRAAEARADEVRRLAWLAAEESARAELEAASLAHVPDGIERAEPPPPHVRTVPVVLGPECVVCFKHTKKLCARCKGVRYCSGKCQIIHWRRGHKDECHPPRVDDSTRDQESLPETKGTETTQSSPSEKLTKLGGNFPTKPVDSVFEPPSSEFDVCQENNNNESKSGLNTSETKSTSDFLTDSSSSSSSSLSSLPPQPPSSESCTPSPPLSSDDASGREKNSGLANNIEVGKASCANSFPDGHGATMNATEAEHTGVPLSRIGNASIANNLCRASKMEKQLCSSNTKDDGCISSTESASMASSVESNGGKFSKASTDALNHEVDHTHLNSKSYELPSKITHTENSAETCTLRSTLRSTLSGDITQLKSENLKTAGVQKLNPVSSGAHNSESIRKSKTLKQQSSILSMHHESSLGGRHSISHDASTKTGNAPKFSSKLSVGAVPNGITDLKTSVRRVVQQFKSTQLPKSHFSTSKSSVSLKHKTLFPYDQFVKLYNCEKVELHPCGLTNCGNSCYANAVLQCLAFTRPLTSYLLQGFHAKTCVSKEWCFTCELGSILAKSKQGHSPVSPVGIVSHIKNIGRNLGPGKQEDAHEFLRYAIDTMQTVCLKESGAGTTGILAEETTLIQLIFGGYLLSTIRCTRCRVKSERRERMMDLTVEIHGDIGTLEEALSRFTTTEILDGENKYQCNRCNSYERAKKKLSVLEAPNVLTIALKRFQSGKFGKLNKAVRFPEHLNLAPYMMSGTDDKSPVYSLYAVVVHEDIMNASFSGHYVCYVKSTQGKWYKTNDSKVKLVDIERVLAKNAYMLLYARCSPRAPNSTRPAPTYDILRTKNKKPKESFHPNWRLPFPKTDSSSSDASSIRSFSDRGSCSTDSTRASTSTESELSDYIFGDSGRFTDDMGPAFIARHSSAGEMDSLSYNSEALYQREYSSSRWLFPEYS